MSNIPQTMFLQGVFLKDLVTMENLFGTSSSRGALSYLAEEHKQQLENSMSFVADYDINTLSSSNNPIAVCSVVNSSNDSYEFSYGEPESYDKIPKIFKNIDEWPERTNIKCLHCAFNIISIPIPLPTAVETTKSSDRVFDVNGICCSFSCAARLITEFTQNSSFRWQRMGMLHLIKGIFYKELYKQESLSQQFGLKCKDSAPHRILNSDIPLAPKRRDICHFGGDISQKEFKHIIHKLNLTIMKSL